MDGASGVRRQQSFALRAPARPVGACAGFTLIELLVVVAVLAAMLGILLPALGRARESGGDAQCLSNLRQCGQAFWLYASDHRNLSPAVGEPIRRMPSWPYAIIRTRDREETGTSGQLFNRGATVLICPLARRVFGQELVNAYAMNGTGHAGLLAGVLGPGSPADPDDFNTQLVFLRMDRVTRASGTPLLTESNVRAESPVDTSLGRQVAWMYPAIDFRQESHRRDRIGRPHNRGEVFNGLMFDGSAAGHRDPHDDWRRPLP